jgi:hypothetical protein
MARFYSSKVMRMKSEEQLPESLLMLRTLLLRQAGARAMPPMSEVGRALCAESDGYCIDEHDHSPSLSLFESPTSGKGLAWRHRLFRVPACMNTMVSRNERLKLPGCLMSLRLSFPSPSEKLYASTCTMRFSLGFLLRGW